jgi:hypothetical protein
VNAFCHWLFEEGHAPTLLRIPRLKEEQKVLATMTPQHVSRLVAYAPPHGPIAGDKLRDLRPFAFLYDTLRAIGFSPSLGFTTSHAASRIE